MKDYDAIVVGAGMGGLSTAAFEKHDKPGGYATSFKLHGVRFDAGIESLPELAPDDPPGSFLSLWGVEVTTMEHRENEGTGPGVRAAQERSSANLHRPFRPTPRVRVPRGDQALRGGGAAHLRALHWYSGGIVHGVPLPGRGVRAVFPAYHADPRSLLHHAKEMTCWQLYY
jgi:hypothetical protein